MRLPKRYGELVLDRDRYANKILLHGNSDEGYDLQTDGRVFLSPQLARRLAAKLLKFAASAEKSK